MIESKNDELSVEELSKVSGGRIVVTDKNGKAAPVYDSGKSAAPYGGKGNLLTTIRPTDSRSTPQPSASGASRGPR